MGKYGEALGQWELRVGGFDKDLKPLKGDNLKLSRILNNKQKKGDSAWLMEEIKGFMIDLISRDYPPVTDEEKIELETYVEFNIVELLKELMITFRWTKREDYEKLEKELIKKGMPQIAD